MLEGINKNMREAMANVVRARRAVEEAVSRALELHDSLDDIVASVRAADAGEGNVCGWCMALCLRYGQ